MRVFKIIFLVLFSLVLLAVTGVYILLTHYKKELTDEVTSTLRKEYGINLETDKITVSLFSNWPHMAVQMKNVKASSIKFKDSEFSARKVSLSVNIRELLNKRIIVQSLNIQDGDILFIKHNDTLVTALRKKPDTNKVEEPIQFEVNKIHFKDTRFRYQAPANGQNFDITFYDNTIHLNQFSDGLEAKLKGDVLVHQLAFRANRGIFLDSVKVRLTLHANYFSDTKTLLIRPGSKADIEEVKYDVTTLVNLSGEKRIALLVSTPKVTFKHVKRIMNNKIRRVLSNYDVAKPLAAKILLVAAIGQRQDPIIIIRATTEHNKVFLGTSKIPYNDIAFSGKIVCMHPSMKKGDIARAHITFERVSGKMYDFPFTARVKVRNLQRPFVSINGKMNIDASKLEVLKNDFELNGVAKAHIRYSGLAEHINKAEFLDKGMKLSADLSLMNLSYKEKKRPYVYTLNGSASIENTDVSFEELHLATAVGKGVLKGSVDNFVNYVLGYSKGFKAKLTAYSDSINLNPVMMQGKAAAEGPAPVRDSIAAAVKEKDNDFEIVDEEKPNTLVARKEEFSSFDFDVNLFAKKMLLRRVYAEDAKVSMNYRDEILKVRSLQVQTCEGRIKATGVIKNFNYVKADLSVEDMDVTTMFSQFENFGQEAIQSENLKGKIYMDAKFSSHLNDQLEVIGETMSGEVRLSLKDGQLLNFEPIQKLSNFLFKNRDFNNITFSELNETFQMRGYEMKIDELEIGSSVLNLYVVDGVYNFKGHSNINVLLPWSNLKKRGKHYVPRTTGERAENTKGVKINFSGPSNKMRVSLGHKELASLKPSI
jgi:hypothetical protein